MAAVHPSFHSKSSHYCRMIPTVVDYFKDFLCMSNTPGLEEKTSDSSVQSIDLILHPNKSFRKKCINHSAVVKLLKCYKYTLLIVPDRQLMLLITMFISKEKYAVFCYTVCI